MNVRCPGCGKQIPYDAANPFRPFCCERCRQKDLYRWLTDEEDDADATADAAQREYRGGAVIIFDDDADAAANKKSRRARRHP